MGLFKSRKTNKEVAAVENAQGSSMNIKDEKGGLVTDQELIAVISGAIAAYEQGGTLSNLVVRKINRAAGITTTWSSAGLNEVINSRRF